MLACRQCVRLAYQPEAGVWTETGQPPPPTALAPSADADSERAACLWFDPSIVTGNSVGQHISRNPHLGLSTEAKQLCAPGQPQVTDAVAERPLRRFLLLSVAICQGQGLR